MVTASVSVLTDEEKINLLVLAMKADGLNEKLVADGVLGEQSIIAAKKFIRHREADSNDTSIPNNRLTMYALDAVRPNPKPAGNGPEIKNMICFFAERGIVLY